MKSREIDRQQTLINYSIVKILNTRSLTEQKVIRDKTFNYIETSQLDSDVKKYFFECLINKEICNYFGRGEI